MDSNVLKLFERIPTLNDNNWPIWKWKVELALNHFDLWPLKNIESSSSSKHHSNYEDKKIQSLIGLWVDDSLIPIIKNCRSSYEMWHNLSKHFENGDNEIPTFYIGTISVVTDSVPQSNNKHETTSAVKDSRTHSDNKHETTSATTSKSIVKNSPISTNGHEAQAPAATTSKSIVKNSPVSTNGHEVQAPAATAPKSIVANSPGSSNGHEAQAPVATTSNKPKKPLKCNFCEHDSHTEDRCWRKKKIIKKCSKFSFAL